MSGEAQAKRTKAPEARVPMRLVDRAVYLSLAVAFLPAIWSASQDDDWTDERTWYKANPNLGVSKTLDYMRRG